VISVQSLSKTYFSHRKQPGVGGALRSLFKRETVSVFAVRDISFRIEEGELVGFLGPNGAGKTTALKMLSGIIYPTSGTASVLGYVPWERNRELQRQFAIVMGQKNQLWWDLPPSESFRMLKEIYQVSDADFGPRLRELSELLDITPLLDVQVRKMSLGERMKCEIAAALLHAPRVLFLDEPTIGLDVVSQQRIRNFIREYNRSRRTTVLLTSHYMRDIQELCERVVIMSRGQIIFDDALAELVRRHRAVKYLRLTFSQPVALADLESYGRVLSAEGFQATIEVSRDECARQASAVLSHLPVADIAIDEPEADEIIREVFEQQARAAT